jgi:hypothetical protein
MCLYCNYILLKLPISDSIKTAHIIKVLFFLISSYFSALGFSVIRVFAYLGGIAYPKVCTFGKALIALIIGLFRDYLIYLIPSFLGLLFFHLFIK